MIRLVTMTVFLALVFSVVCGAAPVYVDNVLLKSDGAVVLSDDFNSGKLDGWIAPDGASIVCLQPNTSSYGLCLYQPKDYAAVLTRSLPVNDPGVLEFSAQFYLPVVDDAVKSARVGLYVRSETRIPARGRMDMIWVELVWNKEHGGYNCDIHWDAKNVCAGTSDGSVKPKKWVTVMLRLDRSTGKITALIDGKDTTSTRCAPENFEVIEGVFLSSSFNDPRTKNQP